MEQLHNLLVFQKRHQRVQVLHLQRVHENYFVFGRHLQQAKLRIVGPIAQKFRVHRKDGRSRRALDKCLETRLVFYDHFPTVAFHRST